MKLFFIHGAGCTPDAFAAQTSAFAGSRALALPGHGNADAGPDTIAAFADAVAAAIAPHGDAILCGSSMGGAIALELALRAHPNLRGVVLIGSGAKLRVAPALFDSLQADFASAAQTLATHFFASPTPERVEAAVRMLNAVGRAQTLRDFRACDAFDATARIGALRCDLLAITGERDVLTPAKFAQYFAEHSPHASACVVPDAGHLAAMERPAEVNALLRAFVKRVLGR